ncbi:MAG: hypothetical protein PHP39_04530 [Oscillospiraceae bacterium]|nr:hypothetical protein [Oscillospiraceae bacterium]
MKTTPPQLEVRRLVQLALATAALFGGQVALAPLPNVEIVTLLLMLYTHWFQRQALAIITVFVLLEGIYYGFYFWWWGYVYIWFLLWLLCRLLDRLRAGRLARAAAGGLYGLGFGLLYAFIYLLAGGWQTAVAWWISGLPFDLLHGVSNFLLIFFLYPPLDRLRTRLIRTGRG